MSKGIRFVLLAIVVQAVVAVPWAGDFRASCVKIDITPEQPQILLGYNPRRSEGVHDRIYHRIVAMDDGKTRFLLISSDLAGVSPSFYDEFSKELEQETGIKSRQVWWAMTHTHSAPTVGPMGIVTLMMPNRYSENPVPNPDYSILVKRLLIEGVREALATLEPARLGVGLGRSLANMNRRAKDVDGSVSLGMNPEGSVDRQIGLIRLDRLDGSPLALIANYAMHGTVLGAENLQISGDAQGIVAEYVEEKLGAPMLYLNGAAGDIAPLYSVYPDPESGHLTQFNVLLGNKILAANQSMGETTSEVRLRIGKTVVETPRKTGFGWVDEMADYLRMTDTGTAVVRIPIRFLRINQDVLLWSTPLELFSEIAIDIRNRSRYPYTFYVGYCNGGLLGYLPTRQAFQEGGYEPGNVTPFTEQVQDHFTHGVISYLDGLPGEKSQ